MTDWFSLIGFQHINDHPRRFIVLKDKISPDCKGFVRRKINICYNAYKRKQAAGFLLPPNGYPVIPCRTSFSGHLIQLNIANSTTQTDKIIT